MCLAFGVERLDDVARAARGRARDAAAAGPRREGARPQEAEVDRRLAAEDRLAAAPCQEVVLTGDDVDLDLLPIQRCWPGDPAPFITLPAVITHDPRTGTRNVGMYRMQKIDARTTFMHWQIHKDGAADWRGDGRAARGRGRARARPGHRVLGERAAAEAHRRAHARRLPPRRAGRARARAKTVDLEVPANAEIVLEGYIEKGELGDRGAVRRPHRLLLAAPSRSRSSTSPRMTMRRDAIYPSIVVGKPPAEDAWLGKATERIFLPARADDRAGDRRLRPAGRGRVPQLRDRLDPQGVSRATRRR